MGEETRPQEIPERETFGAYIQIVGPVFYNRDFSDKTKLLYGLLAAMTQAPKYYAFAKNSTLMRFLNCSERTLQRCLSDLEAANEIEVEDGAGGRATRKIRLTRLQPFYPAKNDGVAPPKMTGVYNNKQIKNNKKGKAQPVPREDVIQRFNLWVARLDLSQEETVKLCTDLHDFVEHRESLGKPFCTIKAATRMCNRLEDLTKDEAHRIPAIRYLLCKTIRNNWSDVFPLKESEAEDYRLFLSAEYGIEAQQPAAAAEYF